MSVLEIFILSILDRAAASPYNLRQKWAISLGASLPSLKRLVDRKLAVRREGRSATNRPRHVYALTKAGRRTARSAWKGFLQGKRTISDLDSVLRIVDMALYYGADSALISSFLRRVGEKRMAAAKQAAMRTNTQELSPTYWILRGRSEASRLRTEGKFLRTVAASLTNAKRTRR